MRQIHEYQETERWPSRPPQWRSSQYFHHGTGPLVSIRRRVFFAIAFQHDCSRESRVSEIFFFFPTPSQMIPLSSSTYISTATSLSLLSSVVLSAFRTRRQVGLENGLAAARRRRTGQKTQPGGNRRAYTGPPCQGSCNMGASVSISLFIPPPPLSSSTTFKDSGTCGRASSVSEEGKR
ncbi:hypothetical protein IWX48DRAFT_365692 [Phyllosticta citricarpa]